MNFETYKVLYDVRMDGDRSVHQELLNEYIAVGKDLPYNAEQLLNRCALIDSLRERKAAAKDIEQFTMQHYRNECGTPACVWGTYCMSDLQQDFWFRAGDGYSVVVPYHRKFCTSAPFYSIVAANHFGVSTSVLYALFDTTDKYTDDATVRSREHWTLDDAINNTTTVLKACALGRAQAPCASDYLTRLQSSL